MNDHIKYRKDIDGLRSIAVISVILFHCGVPIFSGGYIGVDIFFVISGYLITLITLKDIDNKKFSFKNFYKRRLARIFPALILSLSLILFLSFIFYEPKTFDRIAKEVFFSSFGVVNIIFAHKRNYFDTTVGFSPTLHLWSLGVEEQFYIIWPICLILLSKLKSFKKISLTTLGLLITSLLLSTITLQTNKNLAYFYPHLRAYELLIGCLLAIYAQKRTTTPKPLSLRQNSLLSVTALLTYTIPLVIFSETTLFPGYNALLPCLSAAIFIQWGESLFISKILKLKIFVSLGLVSYPLYLFHQPILTFLLHSGIDHGPWITVSIVLAIALPLSYLTYIFIEKPIRKISKASDSNKLHYSLLFLMLVIASSSFYIAKIDGAKWRFEKLNKFSASVIEEKEFIFKKFHENNFSIKKQKKTKLLFLGDSVLQQYVEPIRCALNIDKKDIDLATKAGHVLLDGIEYKNKRIEENAMLIRNAVFNSEKEYDIIFISQFWKSYDHDISNFKNKGPHLLSKWTPFINSTIEKLKTRCHQLVIIGAHPGVVGTKNFRVSFLTQKDEFQKNLQNVYIKNEDYLLQSMSFFEEIKRKHPDKVTILYPYDLWCRSNSQLSDGTYPYFRDNKHLSSTSLEYTIKKLKNLKTFQKISTATK